MHRLGRSLGWWFQAQHRLIVRWQASVSGWLIQAVKLRLRSTQPLHSLIAAKPLRRSLLRPRWLLTPSLLLLAFCRPSCSFLVLKLLLVRIRIPPASLCKMPLFEAYVAPLLAFRKLLFPFAFRSCRLGRVSFSFAFVRLSFSFAFAFSFSFALVVFVVWVAKLLVLAFAFPFVFRLVSHAKLYPTHCSSLIRFARKCC